MGICLEQLWESGKLFLPLHVPQTLHGTSACVGPTRPASAPRLERPVDAARLSCAKPTVSRTAFVFRIGCFCAMMRHAWTIECA